MNAKKSKVNEQVKRYLKNSSPGIVNHIHLLDNPNEDHLTRISVTCVIDQEYLDKNLYYGLSPNIDSEFIHEKMKKPELLEKLKFQNFIREEFINRSNYSSTEEISHFDLNQYKEVFYTKAILTLASHFVRKIVLDTDNLQIEHLKSLLIEENDFIANVTYTLHSCNGKYELNLIGFVTTKMIETLGEFEFIEQFFEFNIELSNSENVYYSGVMPRVISVKDTVDHINANHIRNIIFTVQRTTFATVDTFDNTNVDAHPYLRNLQKELSELYALEDNAQLKLFNSTESLDDLNHYLKTSPNTHTIAVSALLQTKNNFLVFCERSKKSIDKNEKYCSANGQSEFKDKNVKMYHRSADEDYPTLVFSNEYRIDFTSELEREMNAELGNVKVKQKWEYYGVSYLAINNSLNDNIAIKYRRFHFNVLAYNELDNSLISVIENQKKALENFESNKVVGAELFFYNGTMSNIIEKINRAKGIAFNNIELVTFLFYTFIYI